MTFALKELTRLLAQDQAVVGSVVAVEGALVRVATERGAVLARVLDAIAAGDRVLIRNGLATKAPVARHIYPV
ncbi:MAG: hypothetical protein Q8O33_08220 [Pseudomonadota bacterium]|nr:hypothetical protein [Pseudomonadota bacterium]